MTEHAASGDGPQVCLVTMPYTSLTRPSMALGLLKGILTSDGIATTVAYANLWFAEFAGVRLYELCSSRAPTVYLMGEWTFAAAAFGEDRERDERYLQQIIRATDEYPLRHGERGEELAADLAKLRTLATRFVDEAARRVVATGARVVGCTSTFEQHVASLALLRRIRELDPGIVTMLGGANCETVMGEATHRCFGWVDYVVSGEADGLITSLCHLALAQGRDVAKADLPPGVLGPCHREANGQGDNGRSGNGRINGRAVPRALFRDLDSLPTPRYDDYFEALAASPLQKRIRPGLPLETSRGCWWGAAHQCTFCGLNGSSLGFRSKTPERVLKEIGDLERAHGISDFEAVDNILDMAYFRNLLPRLASEPKKRRLFFEVKANLNRGQVESLVRSGITWVQPGIESLHSEVLRLMDKGVQGWQNVQLLKWAREFGLGLGWAILWGFPGESDSYYEEMSGWIPALEHLQAPMSVTLLRYDRYSVYHDQAKRLNLVLFPIGAMSYVYPVSPADLDALAYFFFTEPLQGPYERIMRYREQVTSRPGLQAVQQATWAWQAAFSGYPRPVLSMRDKNGVLTIIDSRSCAGSHRREFTGVLRAVCLACDAAPRAERIAEAVLHDHGLTVPESAVAEAVDELVENRLAIRIDGRVVGLAVRGRLPAVPGKQKFPGGYLETRGLDGQDLDGPGLDGSTAAGTVWS